MVAHFSLIDRIIARRLFRTLSSSTMTMTSSKNSCRPGAKPAVTAGGEGGDGGEGSGPVAPVARRREIALELRKAREQGDFGRRRVAAGVTRRLGDVGRRFLRDVRGPLEHDAGSGAHRWFEGRE